MSQILSRGTIIAPGTYVETLTGNSGGAVGSSGAGNINVLGDGTITVATGNPGTNTITISLENGLDGQLLIGSTAGSLAFANVTSSDASITITGGSNTLDLIASATSSARSVRFLARKGSAGTITPGQVVYISGYNVGQDEPEVELAQSDSALTMPAIGIAEENITNAASGNVVVIGRVDSIDTSTYLSLDELYVSSSVAGALTATRPTGATDIAQFIAEVIRVNPSTGILEVVGSGTVFNAQNIAQNTALIGDSNALPTSTPFVSGNNTSWTITPGTSIVVDVDGAVADSVVTDSGTATPASGALTVAGGSNINTSGASSTVTVNLDDAVSVVTSLTSPAINLTGATQYAVAVYGSSGALSEVSGIGTSGQVLTSNGAGSNPTWQGASAGGVVWSVETGATKAMAVNEAYFANYAGTLAFTLPATAAVGDTMQISQMAAGQGWSLAQNAGQTCYVGNTNTTTGAGGSLASTDDGDWIELVCRVANTDWAVNVKSGNVTVV